MIRSGHVRWRMEGVAAEAWLDHASGRRIAMTPNWWRALFIIAVLTHAAENEALACSCNGTGGPPCQAAWTADVVFAGTVRAVQQIDHETLGAPYHSVLVQFEVERGFVNAVSGPLEIVTGTGGGDCGYRFTTGATLSGVHIENAILAPIHGHLLANATARQGGRRHSLLDVDTRDWHRWPGVRASP